MKIGLLTYHKSYNCGAVLQAYATCRILHELGHEVELIDLRQPENFKLRQVVFIPRFYRINKFCKQFYPKSTRHFSSLKELQKEALDYDCLIVGSDQTWNPLISKNKCLAYFLDFGSEKLKRISYASSFGLGVWPAEYSDLIDHINKLLHRFSAISVREKTGQLILKNQFGLESSLVLDPTMLHTSYDEIMPHTNPNHRIICYLLNRTPSQLDMCRLLSKSTDIKARMISNVYPLSGFEYCYPPAVKGWIEQIAGADMVVTDSFHGLVFSLLYHRQVAVIPVDNGRSSRLLDLLALVGLEDHVFKSVDNLKMNMEVIKAPIDYVRVDSILRTYRKKSIDYLRDNLNLIE